MRGVGEACPNWLMYVCIPPHTHTLAVSVQAMEADGVLLGLRDAMQPPEGVLRADQWGVLERGGERKG